MGASSGLIVAFVVAVWAAYFVPLVLRRYDEAGKAAAIDQAGESGRVITPSKAQAEKPAPPARTLDRPAARLAARRRRRTLLTLLAALVITAGVALGGLIPLWSIAFPAALVGVWLVACRLQVRGELGMATVTMPSAIKFSMPKRSTRDKSEKGGDDDTVDVDDETVERSVEDEDTVVLSGQIEDVDPSRPHVMESLPLTGDAIDDQVVIAVPSVTAHGDALWDPLPITVPTYVTKPRAGRTIRTIDLSQPGTWTSGHVEGEDTELPQRSEHAEPFDERRVAGG